MRTLVKKEIRLLLPAFVGALALAVLPVWLVPYDRWSHSVLPNYLYLFGTVLLALSSFGREIGLKTLPFMLAQPLERARMWWTKIGVLVVFLALVYDAWWLSDSIRSILRPALSLPLGELVFCGLLAVVFVAGGLWMTLLLRHTVAAFLLSLLIPTAAISAIESIGGSTWMCIAALGLYAVAGFFLARRQFLHAQDTAWTGGVLSIGRAHAAVEGRTERMHRPWVALLRKELQLQQFTLIGMGCLFVLHLGVTVLRKAGAHFLSIPILSALEMFAWVWLMAPLVAGGQSVADERQLGTLDGLLCLPFSRRAQFTVKFMVVLVLGGLLSEALVFLAGWVGRAMSAAAKPDVLGVAFTGDGLIHVFFVFVALSLLGFYASTLTRGMVPALAAGVVFSLAYWMLLRIATASTDYFGWRLWPVLAEPLLFVAVLGLAYGNFRYAFESGRRWRRNILGLFVVLVAVNASVAAVYHRVWERVMPFEGSHGPARLPFGNYVFCHGNGSSTLAILLADGRLWQGSVDQSAGQMRASGGHFASGSNWVAASSDWRATFAIRPDGTLWVSEKQPPSSKAVPSPFVQFGTETNWQSVACDEGSFVVLLKRDGTLWRLEKKSPTSKGYEGLRALTPQRLGLTSDWARILQGYPWIYAWKRDGTAWSLHDYAIRQVGLRRGPFLRLDSTTTAIHRPQLDHMQFQSLGVPRSSGPEVGLREDGTLWYWRGGPDDVKQIGHESNWAAAQLGYSQLVALKTNGSIWEWVWDWKFDAEPLQMDQKLEEAPVRVGTQDDWVGLGSCFLGDTVALAADGSLWDLSTTNVPHWFRVNESSKWLAPSGRPAKIENLLDAKE